MYHLVVISLALVAVMTIIGLGFLLPNSYVSGESFAGPSLTENGLSASIESTSGLREFRA